MITWVTVWVLTVQYSSINTTSVYQFEYRTQQTCLTEAKKHTNGSTSTKCNFKQVPMVIK